MDLIIITGDQALFDHFFAPATVVAPPGLISGSGQLSVNSLRVCVEGDEATVVVSGAVYFTPSFPIPGAGTLTIESLGPDQRAKKGKSASRALILKGTKFSARFQVAAPAQVPVTGGTAPDPTPVYFGTGNFITTNTGVLAE